MKLMHTCWRGCTLYVDMMDDLERQRNQTWRIMSTCIAQFRGGPRHGKAHKLYKGDEDNNEGGLLNIDFGGLFRSRIFMRHSMLSLAI